MVRGWLRYAPVLIGLAFAASGIAGSAKLTGVLTQVEGTVQISGPGTRDVPLASEWEVVQAGVTLRLQKGSAAGVVCSNRHFVRLRGPASWTLAEQTCVAGKQLSPGEYALVDPQAGRFRVVNGLLTLEREIRGSAGDDPLAPVLLSPRSTIVRSSRPSISWTRVPSAVEYRIEWSGRACHYDTSLSATALACASERSGIESCLLPWPTERPALAPNEVFILRLAARGGLGESWHWTAPVKVHTLRIADGTDLERRMRSLEELGFRGPGLQVARAGLLAEHGLFAEALDAYSSALSSPGAPQLHVTLADIYLTIGLYQLAEKGYRDSLTDRTPSVQAAAAFGLGRLNYARGHFREAATEFKVACKLYKSLKLNEETAARRAVEKALALSRI